MPHPHIYSPEQSAQKISGVAENKRWVVAHGYGGLCAENLAIEELRARGDALADGLEHAFYDGAAHHQTVDFKNIDDHITAIKEHIPQFYWLLFFDGIMRAYTALNGRNTQDVLDWSAKVQSLSGAKTLVNGIRIGIQQGFGDDMPEAIRIASNFPEVMHPMLFEELGWRVGDETDLTVSTWETHTSTMPGQAECSFAEGMTRGRILFLMAENISWWPHVSVFRTEIPKHCQSHIDSGIAEAILISVGDRAEVRTAEAHRLPRGDIRDGVVRLMNQRLASVP